MWSQSSRASSASSAPSGPGCHTSPAEPPTCRSFIRVSTLEAPNQTWSLSRLPDTSPYIAMTYARSSVDGRPLPTRFSGSTMWSDRARSNHLLFIRSSFLLYGGNVSAVHRRMQACRGKNVHMWPQQTLEWALKWTLTRAYTTCPNFHHLCFKGIFGGIRVVCIPDTCPDSIGIFSSGQPSEVARIATYDSDAREDYKWLRATPVLWDFQTLVAPARACAVNPFSVREFRATQVIALPSTAVWNDHSIASRQARRQWGPAPRTADLTSVTLPGMHPKLRHRFDHSRTPRCGGRFAP